jgi:hypothetical protein
VIADAGVRHGANTTALLLALFIASPISAGDLIGDPIEELRDCERKLASLLTLRVTATYPDVFKADCPGGGLGNSDSVDVTIQKQAFLNIAGVGPPSAWVIESASQDRVEDSGGPNFNFSFTPDSVSGSASCSHGAFGGGITGRFRLTARLRDTMNDLRASHIARLCAALTFHPGAPH